ncbi:hypothetical protein ACQEU8_00980 [Streptomyces sp. CA-250714]|uniref:hypothetical protein n=1 Tax=Streptomyces sp. CA-250714 TaxID=3240060 RepID=UPI003D89E273
MSAFGALAIVTAVIAIVTGAVTYPLVRRDLSPAGALLAAGCVAAAVGAGWLLTLFHALLGFAIGLAVYLVTRRRLTGTQAMMAGGAGYVVSTLLSVGALMMALSGM